MQGGSTKNSYIIRLAQAIYYVTIGHFIEDMTMIWALLAGGQTQISISIQHAHEVKCIGFEKLRGFRHAACKLRIKLEALEMRRKVF